MAAQISDRLTVQEQEIRRLSDEIGRLLELGLQGTVEHSPNPVLEQLRAENEKLKYRIVHLQRSLEEERGGPEGTGKPAPNQPPPPPSPQPGREKHQAETNCNGKEEKSNGEKRTSSKGTGKNENKAAKEANELKQEGKSTTVQDFRRKANGKVCPVLKEQSTKEKGKRTDFLQLIHKREYWDILRRPWKVIFPLEDHSNEHASAIILVRLEECRGHATKSQLEAHSDPSLPRWLHKHDQLKYMSQNNTWNILFQDPSPDNYLLYLKKDKTSLKDSNISIGLHPLSYHLLK